MKAVDTLLRSQRLLRGLMRLLWATHNWLESLEAGNVDATAYPGTLCFGGYLAAWAFSGCSLPTGTAN